MMTSQRLFITTPPNGLIGFDNDKNELYNYAGSFIIRMNGSVRVIFNTAGEMQIDGKVTIPATGTPNLLPLRIGKFYSSNSSVNCR